MKKIILIITTISILMCVSLLCGCNEQEDIVTPEPAAKIISAILINVNTAEKSAEYRITDADEGIPWSQVTATYSGGSAVITDENGDDFEPDKQIELGDKFKITVSSSDTYQFDLIYDTNIIWSSPSVEI